LLQTPQCRSVQCAASSLFLALSTFCFFVSVSFGIHCVKTNPAKTPSRLN
jgi:hypothetical protein